MRKIISLVFIIILHITCGYAQQVRSENSATIYRDLKILKRLPKVLYLAAHPDDENTGLLTWLVNGDDIQTAYLSLTRGDGGQNLLGNEQGAALGLMRTHELLDARQLDGAQQFFSRAVDFGFSKNSHDTFNQWDIDSITSDVVWVIRKFRPDVIICRFPPTAAAGHGQHAASAIAAAKAFDLAGDKNAFAQQLKYVSIWQPKRLLWNTFNFGGLNTTSDNQFKLTAGQYDAELGMGYGELAGLSRSMHKSQGAGTPSVAGIHTEYFSLVKGAPVVHSLFDGIDSSWTSIGLVNIDEELNKVIDSFNFSRPDLSLPALLSIREKLLAQQDKPVVKDKLKSLDNIILSCAGFMGEIITDEAQAVPGNPYSFQLNAIARSGTPVIIENIRWLNDEQLVNKELKNDVLESLSHDITIPRDAHLSEPYWLAAAPASPVQFSVPSDTLIGLPEAAPQLNALVTLKIGNQVFPVNLPLSYKKLDPVKGDIVEPLRIVPALTLSFANPVYFLNNGNQDDLNVSVHFKVNVDKTIGKGTLTFKSGENVLATFPNVALNAKDDILNFSIKKSTLKNLNKEQISITMNFIVDGNIYSKEQHVIAYPHLPTLQYFTPASALALNADMKINAKKIGYIQGAGDFIAQFLTEAGLDVDILKGSDILDSNKLATYDAIVTGVRIISVEKQFPAWYPALMNYVKNGGTLIMQYNNLQDWVINNFGPYPFSVANKRVTDENSEVKFLHPESKLMNYPNKISQEDFKGWIQERGAYFAVDWDKHYTPLFEMHDTNEEPLQGSAIYTQYGKGYYIYTPLAFFRQLPAGNVGAIRLFFNFLSAGK
ncbi:MAG TPA: PIG-L family deacetylase [Arachidicoccus sp.]